MKRQLILNLLLLLTIQPMKTTYDHKVINSVVKMLEILVKDNMKRSVIITALEQKDLSTEEREQQVKNLIKLQKEVAKFNDQALTNIIAFRIFNKH